MKTSSPYPILDNRPIDQWKVTELKEELKRRKLMTKGLKEDLIKRLDEALRNENELERGSVDNGFDSTTYHVVETVEAGILQAASETIGNMVDGVNDINKPDGGLDPTRSDDVTLSLGKEEVCEEKVTGITDYPRDEEVVAHATSVTTSSIEAEDVVSEIAPTVEESEKCEHKNENRDSKSQLENEVVILPCEDAGLLSSDPNNQVSEVSTNLGFQVKSDSISNDCVSINEKNELKDTIIADNVKLEQAFEPKIVQPSSNSVLSDVGDLHPMDAEEPPENKILVEDRDVKYANAEIKKENDSAVVISSEKLNLDRSSGDDSMEYDALESKHMDSKYDNEVGGITENAKSPLPKKESPGDGMQVDIFENKENHDGSNNAIVEPTVKRKFNDRETVGNNETSKRQRRWNSEKVSEPENNIVSSTTNKDVFPPTKRNFSRSDSTASDDVPKERVVPPSLKPPTNSLRIDRFLRPFTLKAVQELLGKTGVITCFWMDHIKTHCYITYSSVEEAIDTRNAVYNLQWPPNGGRLLVAEFVDPQEVKMRVEAPPPLPATPFNSGPTVSSSPHVMQPPTSSHQPLQRQPLPPPPPLPPPLPLSNPPVRECLPPPPPPPERVEPPIVTLDDLFRKTKATPRIYYLPLSDEQVAAKLNAQGKSFKQ